MKTADKGSSIVVMDKDYYLQKITTMLQDKIFYTQIKDDQSRSIIKQIEDLIKKVKNSLNKDEINNNKNATTKILIFNLHYKLKVSTFGTHVPFSNMVKMNWN